MKHAKHVLPKSVTHLFFLYVFLLKVFSSIKPLCEDACFWNWERILLLRREWILSSKGSHCHFNAGGNLFLSPDICKCEISNSHLSAFSKAFMLKINSAKLILPTLDCTECLPMYFTFKKSQIELGTKVDPLWYSFSLWSEYFDIVSAPGEPFPVPWDWTQ